jgi:hypothetical protein
MLGPFCMHDRQEMSVLIDLSGLIWFPNQNKYGPKSLSDGLMRKNEGLKSDNLTITI